MKWHYDKDRTAKGCWKIDISRGACKSAIFLKIHGASWHKAVSIYNSLYNDFLWWIKRQNHLQQMKKKLSKLLVMIFVTDLANELLLFLDCMHLDCWIRLFKVSLIIFMFFFLFQPTDTLPLHSGIWSQTLTISWLFHITPHFAWGQHVLRY